ncbi:MAG TPA: ABC transporter permease [Actinomycetes bacterium]
MTAPARAAVFAPRPGAAPLGRMLLAQTGLEVRMMLRNGEQLLLTIVIPVLVLTVYGSVELMDLGSRSQRLEFLVPGVLALAVLSTAFTGLAIGTGFERRYGALKRLGASPLSRSALLAAKGLSVLAVETLQVVLLGAVALAMGWAPPWSPGTVLAAVVLLLAGTAAFSALALLMAGTLRAEATLAGANLVYLLLLVSGGIAVPLDRFPDASRPALETLPAGALAEGLREVLADGAGLPVAHLLVLLAWAAAAGVLAARTFRWE